MDERERMLEGLPYFSADKTLAALRLACRKRTRAFNDSAPDDPGRAALLGDLLGSAGAGAYIEPPFYCDYGRNIHVGSGFYANFGCTLLDVAEIRIGDRVMLGPNVSIYTAGHPLHAQTRASGFEYGASVTIGDDVWLGGGAIVCPGVSIGSGTVVGAGSVVMRDLPAGVVAAGNPCRVIRQITEDDRDRYFRGARYPAEELLRPRGRAMRTLSEEEAEDTCQSRR